MEWMRNAGGILAGVCGSTATAARGFGALAWAALLLR